MVERKCKMACLWDGHRFKSIRPVSRQPIWNHCPSASQCFMAEGGLRNLADIFSCLVSHWSMFTSLSLISYFQVYFWGSPWRSLGKPDLMSCCMVLPLGLEVVERFRASKGQNRCWSYWDFASRSVMEIMPVLVALHWRWNGGSGGGQACPWANNWGLKMKPSKPGGHNIDSDTGIRIAIQWAWCMDKLPLSTTKLLQQGQVNQEWYGLRHCWFLDPNLICLLGLGPCLPEVTGFWNRTREGVEAHQFKP